MGCGMSPSSPGCPYNVYFSASGFPRNATFPLMVTWVDGTSGIDGTPPTVTTDANGDVANLSATFAANGGVVDAIPPPLIGGPGTESCPSMA